VRNDSVKGKHASRLRTVGVKELKVDEMCGSGSAETCLTCYDPALVGSVYALEISLNS